MKVDRARMYVLALVIIFPIVILILSTMAPPSSALLNTTGQNPSGSGSSGQLTATTSVTFRTEQGSQGPASDLIVTLIGQSSSPLDYSYLILAVIVVLLTAFFASSSKKGGGRTTWTVKPQKHRSKALLAIMGGYIGLVLLGLYLASEITLPIFEGSSISITYGQIVQLIIVAISFSVIALSFYLFYRTRSQGTDERSPRPVNPTDELLSILQNAASKLDQENVSYRGIIIDCYKQLLLLFERLGIPQRSNLTPREFEDEITIMVGVSFPQLRELTLLFERAKYSNEDLSKEDVTRARDSLSGMGHELERQLDGIILPAISKMH
jgi:hypothetical protein